VVSFRTRLPTPSTRPKNRAPSSRLSSLLFSLLFYITGTQLNRSTIFIRDGRSLQHHTTPTATGHPIAWDKQFFSHEDGVGPVPKRACLLNVCTLRIPQMIWVWRATVERYIDRGKRKNPGRAEQLQRIHSTTAKWRNRVTSRPTGGQVPALNKLLPLQYERCLQRARRYHPFFFRSC
jgi:hypothetical protein